MFIIELKKRNFSGFYTVNIQFIRRGLVYVGACLRKNKTPSSSILIGYALQKCGDWFVSPPVMYAHVQIAVEAERDRFWNCDM